MTISYRPQNYKTLRQRLPQKLDWLLHDIHWAVLRGYHGVFRSGFEFSGQKYHYEFGRRGIIQERAIEIPLAEAALGVLPSPVEVGCVMPHFGNGDHEVIDLYEKCGFCRNMDAATYSFADSEAKSVLSISTLEHIGWDLPEPVDANKSVEVLRKILTSGKPYFVSFPLGYNPYLTSFLERDLFHAPDADSSERRLTVHVAIFKRILFDRWRSVTLAPGDFSRMSSLNRKPTKYVAFLWNGVDVRPTEKLRS